MSILLSKQWPPRLDLGLFFNIDLLYFYQTNSSLSEISVLKPIQALTFFFFFFLLLLWLLLLLLLLLYKSYK